MPTEPAIKRTIASVDGQNLFHAAKEAFGYTLDILGLGHRNSYDVALVFSQDQDLSEVADDIRTLAREQHRWLKIASHFFSSPPCADTLKKGLLQ